jgi:hypothetical protein
MVMVLAPKKKGVPPATKEKVAKPKPDKPKAPPKAVAKPAQA